MPKPTVHFEQISVAEVKALLGESTLHAATALQSIGCRICRKPVTLATAKTNEDGQAVHEQCYVASLQKRHLAAHSRDNSHTHSRYTKVFTRL